MIQKITLELDEAGFAEYTNAITAYRNAEVIAFASDIITSGYGKQATRIVGINIYFLKETEVVALLKEEIKLLREYNSKPI